MSRLSRTEYLASWCIGIGIVLLLLGVRGLRYIPMTPEEARAEEALQAQIALWNQILSQAPSEARELVQPQLEQMQRQSIRFKKEPPYRSLGRWGLGIGLLLIVIGVIGLQYRPTEGRWVRTNEDV